MTEFARDSAARASAAINFAADHQTDADSRSRTNQKKILQSVAVRFPQTQTSFIQSRSRRVVFDDDSRFAAARSAVKFHVFERSGDVNVVPVEMRRVKQFPALGVRHARNADADDFQFSFGKFRAQLKQMSAHQIQGFRRVLRRFKLDFAEIFAAQRRQTDLRKTHAETDARENFIVVVKDQSDGRASRRSAGKFQRFFAD